MSLESHSGPPRWSRIAGAALLAAMFAVNVYRAATQSVVHDEALTYNWYLAGPLRSLFDMSANNHILHSILAKISVKIVGHSELGLRVPSLGGGALSFIALWLMGVRACSGAAPFLLMLSLAALNPLFLDFCCVARGYGLATAFMLWALYFAMRATDGTLAAADSFSTKRLWLLCSVSLGLSLSANLSLLFANTAIAGMLAIIVLRERAKTGSAFAAARSLFVWLALPGPLIATVLWAPVLRHAQREHFYVGWPALRDSAGEFISAALFHDGGGVRSVADHVLTPYELLGAGSASAQAVGWLASLGFAVVMILFAGAAVTLAVKAIRQGVAALDHAGRLLLLASTCLIVALGAYALLHIARGVLYPPDRAIVFLVPLLAIAWVLLPHALSAGVPRRTSSWVAGAIAAVVIVFSAAGIRTTYFRTWRYDAGTKDMVYRMHAASPNGEVRVTSHWIYAPTLHFYRNLIAKNDHADWLHPEQPYADSDFFILHPDDNPRLDDAVWTLLYNDPVSGANLYQRKGQPVSEARREP